MAKASSKRLKVFQAQLGFYDTVVAASSQAAALRAWGLHQNLFTSGQAKVTDDAQAVRAALAKPETPLVRAIGSKDAFAVDAKSPPDVPAEPKARKAKAVAKPKPAPPSKPTADRSALDAAERALRKLEDLRKREEAALSARQDALDGERAAAQDRYVERRKAAASAVVEAREAYRKDGGAG